MKHDANWWRIEENNTAADWLEKHEFRCSVCGEPITYRLPADLDARKNLDGVTVRYLCKPCNRACDCMVSKHELHAALGFIDIKPAAKRYFMEHLASLGFCTITEKEKS